MTFLEFSKTFPVSLSPQMSKKQGRPPKSPDVAKTKRVEFRATTSEVSAYNRAAVAAGMERSEWIRMHLNAAAKRSSQ